MAIHSVVSSSDCSAESQAVGAQAPKDLREWLAKVETIGQVHHIKTEVDWDQEMGAISYMAHRQVGAPAIMFENIRGYGSEVRSLWGMIGSGLDRLAIAVGLPVGLKPLEMIKLMRGRMKRRIPPVIIDPAKAPVNENVLVGDQVDVLKFPIPKHWPRDGGRYAGTCDAVITRDPEDGWINIGTYRMMVHDRNHVGLYISPGKDARIHLERARKKGQPLEVAAVWGNIPAVFVGAALSYPKTQSEYDYIGGLMGQPVEVIKGVATDLLIPANAEIIIEGIIYPDANRMEGPFGEFTGYYGRPEDMTPVVEVKAIHYRNNPIHTNALMADYPACEGNALYVARSARIWEDLDRLGVPGIKGVWANPAAAGYGMTVVSLEQRYAGHAPQVLALAAQSPGGAYFSKWIVAVDEDVDPTDINQVIWAMATRCNPVEDIDILRQTWSTWLDPTQNPPEERPYGSKALVNACKEHKYVDVFSPRTKVARGVYEKIRARWSELGLPGQAPELWALEG